MPHAPQTAIVRILQGLTSARNIKPGDRIEIKPPLAALPAKHLATVLKDLGIPGARPQALRWFHESNLPARSTAEADVRKAAMEQARAAGLGEGKGCAGFEYLALLESGDLLPGETCLGLGPEIHVLGGAAALGLRATTRDLAYWVAGGQFELTVPQTVKLTLHGKPLPSVGGGDVFWAICKECGFDSLAGRALEISGDGLRELSVARRLTLAGFAARAGLFALYIAPDAALVAEVNRRLSESLPGSLRRNYETVNAEAGAEYALQKTLDLAKVQPTVVPADTPQAPCAAGERSGERVDRVQLAGTACSLEALRLVAARVKGKTLASPMDIAPSTPAAFAQALADGSIATLVESGASVHPPGSGEAQLGQPVRGQRWLSTLAFVAAHGGHAGEYWLCSPAVAAASALAGSVAHPDAPEILPARDSKLSARRRAQ